MKIYPIEAGNFKLDGGAMFGVVPKSIWQKTNPADQNNLVDVATRCLLIEDAEKLILVDCGIGYKQDEKFFSHYYRNGDFSIEKSLRKYGFTEDDITDVFLTHLHFDHVGGATKWNDDKSIIIPTFKNAKYWTNKNHWEWAINPNPREKASFLKDNLNPLIESGQLNFIDLPNQAKLDNTFLGFDILFLDGHTEKQMLPILNINDVKIAFMGDLIPTVGHIPLPYVTGYDVRPLESMKEKEIFLNTALKNNYLLFFEHDSKNVFADLIQTERGIRLNKTYSFEEIL